MRFFPFLSSDNEFGRKRCKMIFVFKRIKKFFGWAIILFLKSILNKKGQLYAIPFLCVEKMEYVVYLIMISTSTYFYFHPEKELKKKLWHLFKKMDPGWAPDFEIQGFSSCQDFEEAIRRIISWKVAKRVYTLYLF